MKKCKRLIIFSGNSGSLINFRYELILELSKFYSITLLAPFNENIKLIKKKFKNKKINLINIDLIRNKYNIFSDLKTLYILFINILKLNPQLIISYNVKPVIFTGLVLSFFSNVKYIPIITGLGFHFINNNFKTKFFRSIIKFLYKFSLNKAKVIIFQNKDDRNLFLSENIIKKFQKILIVNGSGINLKIFKKYKLPLKNIFLMSSRILREKGVFEYIKASIIVKKFNNNCFFFLAGGFDNGISFINKKKFLNIIKKSPINYLGHVNDMKKFLKKSKFYILPSYREGTSHSILEALATGRPVITTKVPGCKNTVVNNKNGYLVKSKSHISLAKAMIKIINKDHVSLLKMANYSNYLAKKKFDVNKINLKILQTIKNHIN